MIGGAFMNLRLKTIFAVCFVLISFPFIFAYGQTIRKDSQELNKQAYVELLKIDIEANEINVISEVLQLDETDAGKFWPVFKEYDAELDSLDVTRYQLIQDYVKNYTQMTDEKANELIMSSFELEGKRNDLKKKYYEKMKAATSAITAARFFQIENQIETVEKLQVQSMLPVME
jgi:hypothetical protein